ncbi:hypothetical protein BD414DRAFT_149740 [Trametes punicea]|nr:hypothetical protein BD414DRAFT_149740 [Trametes punicea]
MPYAYVLVRVCFTLPRLQDCPLFYLLVDCVREAEDRLQSKAGHPPRLRKMLSNSEFRRWRRLCSRADVLPCVVTNMSPIDDHDEAHHPTLPQLYNALAQRFLNTEYDSFRRYLSLQIGYSYRECEMLASPTFVGALPPDIRQFRLDWLSKTLRMHTEKTIEREGELRARARRGEWEPVWEGTTELGGSKIDRAYEASVLALATLEGKADKVKASSGYRRGESTGLDLGRLSRRRRPCQRVPLSSRWMPELYHGHTARLGCGSRLADQTRRRGAFRVYRSLTREDVACPGPSHPYPTHHRPQSLK